MSPPLSPPSEVPQLIKREVDAICDKNKERNQLLFLHLATVGESAIREYLGCFLAQFCARNGIWPKGENGEERVAPTPVESGNWAGVTLTVSVDRVSRNIGIFNDHDMIDPFRPYVDEAEAIRLAKEWCVAASGNKDVEVVYPRVTKMVMSK